MSISNLLYANSLDLYCRELNVLGDVFIGEIGNDKTLTIIGNATATGDISAATFNGNPLPVFADYIQRTPLNVLTSDTLIAGSGTNVVKDTLISVLADNINLPANKGYYVNSQPMVYEQTGVYKVDADVMTVNTSLTSPIVQSKVAQEIIISSDTRVKLIGSSADNICPVVVANSADQNKQLCFAYDSTLDRGKIAAIQQGVGFKPLQIGYDNSTHNILVGDNKFTKSANQLLFQSGETGFQTAINVVQPTGNWVYNIIDTGVDDTFVMRDFAQVLSNKTLPTLKTNSISSIGTNDDIVIDANGTGIIRLNTVENGGVKIVGSNNTNFGLSISNVSNAKAIVAGVYQSAGEDRPTIGAQTSSFSAWSPLWIQSSGDLTPVIIANVSEATATATGAKLYVAGPITTDTSYKINSTVVLSATTLGTSVINSSITTNTGSLRNVGSISSSSSIRLRDNLTNAHILTSGIAPSGARNHFLIDKSGTLCHTEDRMLTFPFVSDIMTSALVFTKIFKFAFGGASQFYSNITYIDMFVTAGMGFTASVQIYDTTNSVVIADLINFVGTGTIQKISLTNIGNLPTDSAEFEIQALVGTSVIFSLSSVVIGL